MAQQPDHLNIINDAGGLNSLTGEDGIGPTGVVVLSDLYREDDRPRIRQAAELAGVQVGFITDPDAAAEAHKQEAIRRNQSGIYDGRPQNSPDSWASTARRHAEDGRGGVRSITGSREQVQEYWREYKALGDSQ